jgi:prepilin-type N-terminal cleavage/methylation domain-containing protein
MHRLLERFIRREKGFTLMEMLITVAIIAILVVIAIPVFNIQLAKAKQATDDANCRSAKALATTECLVNDQGNFGAKTESEWIAFVEACGIPANGKVDSASTLQCTIDDSSITFQYGAGDSGNGGGTSDGSITVTDSQGATHTIKASGNWEQLKASVDGGGGVAIPEGVVFSDSTGTYVGGYTQYVRLTADTTLAQALQSNSASLLKITSATKVWVDADKVSTNGSQTWPSAPQLGELYYTGGTFYIVSQSGYSIWDTSPARWIKLI